MTVIRPNGISGVTSITSSGDAINFYRSDGTLGPELGINVNVTSGISTFAALNVTGVLTYEDVASVDSVGIITARDDLSIADKIIHTGDTNTAIRFPAADTVTVETGGSERVRIDSSGRMGLGTASPSTKLEVADTVGTVRATSTDTTFVYEQEVGRFEMYTPDGSGGGAGIAGYTASVSTSVVGSQYALAFGTKGPSDVNAVERLRIDQLGNVGIGTAVPAAKLEIGGIASSGQTEAFTIDRSDGVQLFSVDYNATGNAVSLSGNNKNFVFKNGSSSSETMRIDSSGNMGLGTASPSWILSIERNSSSAGTGQYPAVQINNTNSSGYAALYLNDSTGLTGLETRRDTSHLGMYAGGSERVRIDSSGQMGIGETSPVDLLHIKSASGNANVRLTTGNTSSGYTGLIFGDTSDTNTGALQYDHSNDSLQFEVNNTERMRIDSSGNVGIEHSSPTSLLAIGGNAVTTAKPTVSIVPSSGNASLTLRGGAPTIHFDKTGTGNNGTIIWDSSTSLVFKEGTLDSSTERMRIDSSGKVILPTGSPGIQFGSSDTGTNITSQTLDDYEEGTFTPTFLVNNSTAGVTYAARHGHYVKIGNKVTIWGIMNISNNGSSTGYVSLGNFPFTVGSGLNNTSIEGGGHMYYQNNVSGVYGPITIGAQESDTIGYLYAATSTNGNMGSNPISESNINNNFNCRFMVTYKTT